MSNEELLLREEANVSLEQWREQEKTALELLNVTGELRFDRSIELVLFRREIYDSRPSEILQNLQIAKNYTDRPPSIDTVLSLAYAVRQMDGLAPCKLDLGRLALEWQEEGGRYGTFDEFAGDKLRDFCYRGMPYEEPRDVVLYGFGRIGRLLARRIISQTGKGEQLRLKAIVVRPKLKDPYEEAVKRASLLRSDSVHGDFHGVIDVAPDGNELIVNGNRIKLIYAAQPKDIDYRTYGIKDAIVIDNTGVWRDREGLGRHLRPGVDKVILTAPGKGIPNIVYGINHESVDLDEEAVLSAASCTTNAIVPALKVLHEAFGIEKGHVETIHAYTNDQNLLDNFHKKPRRGRGAPINMVITTTGAAKAVAKALPELEGKLTGNAVRVPVPDVSLAILSLHLSRPVSKEQVNEVLKTASLRGPLMEQIHYSNSAEFVSSNAIGMTTSSVVDAPSTIVSADGMQATVYLWYDNEYGYSCQVVRLAKYVARVRRYVYY